MTNRIAKLLSVPPGEENKTFLLFAMHLLFYVGLRWGDTAGQSLFQSNWGKDSMSVIFFLSAPIMLVVFVVYGRLTRRWSNERLLVALTALMLIWLASAQVLLAANIGVGPSGPTYLYFYLGYLVLADTAALNILNYINDLYDTRAAKQVLPFLLSAALAGSAVAGFSALFFNNQILIFLPSIWGLCLAGLLGLVAMAHRHLAPELIQAEQARRGKRQAQGESSFWHDLRLFQQWSILRWLAISTLVVVILMRLLTISSTNLVNQSIHDQLQVFVFYNVLDGVSSVIGLVVSSVLIGRLMVRLGLGVMNLVFPVVTLLIVILINPILVPGLVVASLARENDRVIKKVFRNPIEAIFSNSVPLNIKVQARALINMATVPLGTFLAGALGLLVKFNTLTAELVAWLAIVAALLYLAVSWFTRQAYSRAMLRLVATDDLAVFRAGYSADDEEIDSLTIRRLAQRLRSGSDDADTTMVLAEMLYDFQGRNALRTLCNVASAQPSVVRAFIIRLIGVNWIGEPLVHELCISGLRDADLEVQRAAVVVLASDPTAAQDEALLNQFMRLLHQRDETLQASMLPLLLASDRPACVSPAMQILSEWLSDAERPARRTLGLRVVAQRGDARLIEQLRPYLSDTSALVRTQVVESIGQVAARSAQRDSQQQAIASLQQMLADEDIGVRLAAVMSLGQLNRVRDRDTALAAGSTLIAAMHDRHFRVRRAATLALSIFSRAELEQAYRSEDSRVVESAAFVLAHAGKEKISGTLVKRRLVDLCEEFVMQHDVLRLHEAALRDPDTPAVGLLRGLFSEQAQLFLRRTFWLLSALADEATIDTVQRSLHSQTPRVRANALELLEAISSPRLAHLISPLYETTNPAAIGQAEAQHLNLPAPSLWNVVLYAWPQLRAESAASTREWFESSDLLTAAGMYAAADVVRNHAREHVSAAAERVPITLQTMLHSDQPLLRETAQAALALLDESGQEQSAMLTMIEKVVFLKRVTFFQDIPTNDLRLLASVSEEASFNTGEHIITEDEPNDALFIVVNGRVAIQHRRQDEAERTLTQLATLGPRDYFGEMSLFDEAPSSADVVAMIPTHVLLLRRTPLFNLLERQPGIALSLFKGLSQRLRQANELLARRRR